jgi:HAD superfamily hydrolase (TIGR01459 family)
VSTVEITGLRDVAGRYSTLFVDAYGVLYDGGASFPGAPEALARARQEGLRVCIVTNSASRVEVVASRLAERAGVTPEHYDAIATSGELTWEHLGAGAVAPDVPVFVISEEGGPAWVAEIAQPVVRDISEAGAIVAVGTPWLTEAAFHAGGFAETMREGVRRGLPMIVADSDETYPWRGVMRLGAGWIARLYATMGGTLVEFGKPHRPIYEAASGLLGATRRGDILAIGDNLLTDIAGAAGYGIDSMLVLEGGVHGSQPLHEVMGGSGAKPTYVAPRLSW